MGKCNITYGQDGGRSCDDETAAQLIPKNIAAFTNSMVKTNVEYNLNVAEKCTPANGAYLHITQAFTIQYVAKERKSAYNSTATYAYSKNN